MIAIIADIHGNSWALEAVLAEIRRRGIRDVVNLGDCLYGPLDPEGTFRILRDLDWPTVRGNQDRILMQEVPSRPERTHRFVLEALSQEGLEWVSTVPRDPFVHGAAFLCHGTPHRDDEYLLETVTADGVGMRSGVELDEVLSVLQTQLVFCAHSHVPRLVQTPTGRTVVNPGSVGLPAFDDESPHHHRMESWSPHARFAVVSETENGWSVDHVSVPYSVEIAARTAKENGREDWSYWLRTGWGRPFGGKSAT
jgi:predicted phosphodiesterase